jgi:hypothetical protein
VRPRDGREQGRGVAAQVRTEVAAVSATTPCYAGYCPRCGGMIAVAVAPAENPEIMRDALASRDEWEDAGMRVGMVSVEDVRNGAMQGHVLGCSVELLEVPL